MTSFRLKITTAWALGVPNLWRVMSYRIGLRLGLNSIQRLRATIPTGPFFRPVTGEFTPYACASNWMLHVKFFGHLCFPIDEKTPCWHESPLSRARIVAPERDWWQIPDFDPAVGDIKAIWEASRFDWVLTFAQHARSGEADAFDRLNAWIEDWTANNPPFKGPNWKCGQEASIRVMHLAMAAVLIDQVNEPLPALMDLISLHLRRIAPTIRYAIAQDNNHGTSEAAALFIGGSLLAKHGRPEGARWARMGRKWLEERAARLIEQDGSFSQYSLNYHRVMLDTFCIVEVWRRAMTLPRFSSVWYEKSTAATTWLYVMIDAVTGDGPNLGANDGARLLPLTDTDYRDYRPTVQLAMALFARKRAYARVGIWNLPLHWLGVDIPDAKVPSPGSMVFDRGGFAVLRQGRATALLRYPRFRFRPSHADALHVDLWVDGCNLLRDAGTYCYNTDPRWSRYFPGTESHNTVEFDGRDQMPRLSRFLFGGWLKASSIQPLRDMHGTVSFGAAYQDDRKSRHARSVELGDNALLIVDCVSGFAEKAVLRWRLQPGNWKVEGNTVKNGDQVLHVSASVTVTRFELIEGWESRYYLQKEPAPVLEIEIHESATITSQYRWTSSLDDATKLEEREATC